MVLTSCPSAMIASVVQDLTALPSRCTTQAPHCEVSQPTWVPVRRRFSRRNCTSNVRGSMSAVTGLPFTVSDTAGEGILLSKNAGGPIPPATGCLQRGRGEFLVDFPPSGGLEKKKTA